ncbi:MAG: SNF2-related protein, partial [Thaumarchaeota archaeon]|nr:SNF2-related protein [Nitrososphaerota archaeon]
AYKDVELEYSAGLIPAAIAQYLRDYQIEGVRFLHQMFVYQKGGILGDDMGLGKTVQVAAFLTAAFGKTGDERDAKRMRKYRRAGTRWYPKVLIVCPGSLIQNWKNELNRWGWWHVDLFHGAGKEDVIQTARAGRLEVMVTTYVTYKNNRDLVNTVQWDAVVADECHVLKEGSAEVTRAMNQVNALCRIGLTGTAIQNRYEELWTLLNWTNPGHFGTLAEWKQTISRPLTVGQSHDATLYQLSQARKTAKKLVQNLLPEFFLRRMKSLIAHQLPRKSDRVVFCPLTDVQRGAYENFLQSYQVQIIREASDPCPCGSGRDKGWCCHARLEDGRTWQGLVFPTIFTLQRLANHLTLLIPASGEPTERQQAQLATLQKCVPDGWEELYRGRDS